MRHDEFLTAMIIFTVLVLHCESINAQHTTNPGLAEAKKAIAESNAIYFQAFAKGDSSLFINRYAKDCCIMAPNAPAMCGANAALDFFRIAYNEIGLRNGKFTTTDIFGDGEEFMTEIGLWQSVNAKGELFDDGKFLVLWKKTPEGWKMFRDSFSSNHNFSAFICNIHKTTKPVSQ